MVRRNAVHQLITSRKAPKPIGSYAQAVLVNQPGAMLFISGQIPIEVPSGKLFTGDIKRQAEIALGHVRSIISDAKFSMDEVVKVTIYLTDLANFDVVNSVYAKFFVGQSVPARAVVGVASLPKNVGIEIEAQCIKQASSQPIFTDDDFR
jgi:2-iminobutanoate/2-iminopropanoate deaminase